MILPGLISGDHVLWNAYMATGEIRALRAEMARRFARHMRAVGQALLPAVERMAAAMAAFNASLPTAEEHASRLAAIGRALQKGRP